MISISFIKCLIYKYFDCVDDLNVSVHFYLIEKKKCLSYFNIFIIENVNSKLKTVIQKFDVTFLVSFKKLL